jgi:hypothetical protein
MINAQQTVLENEIISAAFAAEKAISTERLSLSVVADRLETLARAFREHPEEVRPLPDPHSLYDYSAEVAVLRDGEKAIRMCADLCILIEKSKQAEMRKGMLISEPFASHDSDAP